MTGSIGKNTFYLAIGAMAVLFIALAAYTIVQLNSLNKQLSSQTGSQLDSRVAAIEYKLAGIEQQLKPNLVKMQVYYDSKDAFTASVAQNVASLRTMLAGQGLDVELADVTGRTEEFRKNGFRELPAGFISEQEAAKDTKLYNSLQTQPTAKVGDAAGYRIDTLGFLAQAETVLDVGCKGTAPKLYAFVAADCKTCGPLYTAVEQTAAKHGAELTLRHMPTGREGSESWNASMAIECARQQGKLDAYLTRVYNATDYSPASLAETAKAAGLDAAEFATCAAAEKTSLKVNEDVAEAKVTYSFQTAPFFIVDCSKVYLAANAAEVESFFCKAAPSACASSSSSAPAGPAANSTA